MSEDVIIEKIESIKTLMSEKFAENKESHDGIIARQDKTNGNVMRNTEFRLQATGVIGLFKWIGIANIAMFIVVLGGSIVFGFNYFTKPAQAVNKEEIKDVISTVLPEVLKGMQKDGVIEIITE